MEETRKDWLRVKRPKVNLLNDGRDLWHLFSEKGLCEGVPGWICEPTCDKVTSIGAAHLHYDKNCEICLITNLF